MLCFSHCKKQLGTGTVQIKGFEMVLQYFLPQSFEGNKGFNGE